MNLYRYVNARTNNLRAAIDQAGSLENFLNDCEESVTDVLSTFDVTDEEWAAVQREWEGR